MKFEILNKYTGYRVLGTGYCFVVLSLLLSSCTGAQLRNGTAINTIPTQIREDLTVSGTIRIKGEVKVFSGVTLTVKPGTRFLFEPYDPDEDGVNDSRLLIEGVLVARGDPDAPIYFSSAAAEPEPGDWLELRMDHSEGSVLEYCVLEDSRYGLHVHFSSGVVSNSIFRKNIDGTRFGNSRFTVMRNRIAGNSGKGINLRQSKILITANIIEQNRHGIFLFEEGSESSLVNNLFAGNRLSDLRFGDFYGGAPPQISGNGRDDGQSLILAGPIDADVDDEVVPPPLRDVGPQVTEISLTSAWEVNVGSFVDAPINSYSGKGTVAAATWGGDLLQLDLIDGSAQVIAHVGDIIDAEPLYLKLNETPFERIIYPAWDRTLYSVNAKTGKIVGELQWEGSPADDHRQGAPIMAGSHLYIGLWNGDLAEVDLVKMDWLWKTRLDGAVRTAPAIDGENLWIGTDGGSLHTLGRDGSIIRSFKTGSPVRTTPAVLGNDDVVAVTGEGILMRVSEGEVVWRRQLPGAGTYASPLQIDATHILVGDGSGAVSLYDQDGALFWRTDLGSAIHMVTVSYPAIWAGTEDGRLAAINPLSGAVLAELKSGSAVHSRPWSVPGDHRAIVWASRDGFVRKHAIKVTQRMWEGPVR